MEQDRPARIETVQWGHGGFHAPLSSVDTNRGPRPAAERTVIPSTFEADMAQAATLQRQAQEDAEKPFEPKLITVTYRDKKTGAEKTEALTVERAAAVLPVGTYVNVLIPSCPPVPEGARAKKPDRGGPLDVSGSRIPKSADTSFFERGYFFGTRVRLGDFETDRFTGKINLVASVRVQVPNSTKSVEYQWRGWVVAKYLTSVLEDKERKLAVVLIPYGPPVAPDLDR
jgi:hypothetical protein